MMKYLYAIAFAGVLLQAAAQTNELCQGAYYTEAQGAEKLRALRNRLRTKEAWAAHADSIRNHIRKGMGLEVWPAKTPLNPRFRNKKTMDGYTVEAVAFESFPGFYVTGNLYRPTATAKPKSLAAVLCPHGHSSDTKNGGRLSEAAQTRSAALARMGSVVFAFDMIGYGESDQLPHKFEKVLALQTWNSLRAIDFLLSLPEVDENRVAVTGESGGGTQTFILTALDERVKASVPVVMVSAHFFGGCSCESGMPIHKNGKIVYTNAEIASLAAPRPMLLVSDGQDWTKNTETVEFPFAKKVYQLLGADGFVENVHLSSEGHDYGPSKRIAMYNFLARHLKLQMWGIMRDGRINESFVKLLPREELVFFKSNELASMTKGDALYTTFRSQIK